MLPSPQGLIVPRGLRVSGHVVQQAIYSRIRHPIAAVQVLGVVLGKIIRILWQVPLVFVNLVPL